MGGFYHEEGQDSSLGFTVSGHMDRGLAYAEACFETVRVVSGCVFAWDLHARRLRNGLAAFGLRLSDGQLDAILRSGLDAARAVGDDVLLRITVSGGEAAWGLLRRAKQPHVHLQCLAMGRRDRRAKSLELLTWPFPPKAKPAKFTADYAEILRALRGRADADALFVHEGRILGAATANVLLYRDRRWWSPEGIGVLPGVIRDFLARAGVVMLAACPAQWLLDAEAVVLSNSGLFLQPVDTIRGHGFGVRRYDYGHEAISHLAAALRGRPGVPQELIA